MDQDKLRQEKEGHLRQAERMEALGRLAGGVAHDFNNALSSVLGFTSYLRSKASANSDLHRDLGLIEQAALKAADLTRQLVSLARAKHVSKEPLSLSAIAEAALKNLGDMIPPRIAVTMSFAGDLPVIEGEEERLRRAITDLCLFCIESMNERGGTLAVKTEFRELDAREKAVLLNAAEGKFVCVTISDTGPALAAELLEHLFDPFYKTRTGKGKPGLGLSVARGIVANHRGDILAESTEGHGTTFQLCFALPEGRIPRGAPAVETLSGTETILVVDDEPIILEMLPEVLHEHGYTVVTAASGEAALDLLSKPRNGIRLVILDLIMPGMSGDVAFQLIRESYPNMPVLLTTGYVEEAQSERLMRQGAKGIIPKPCKSADMLKLIRGALAG